MISNIIWITSLIFTIFVLKTNGDILVYVRGTSTPIEEFHDLPSRFGPPFPVNGMRLMAVQANPSNACSEIFPPPQTNKTETIRWVAVIARYNCSFEEKVRNAQKANFSAVIIYNLNSDDLEQMSANNDDGIKIPSMFVGESTGKIIIYNYQYQFGFALVLNGDLPFDINTHLILPFTIVVGMCFIIMVGFMIIKCIREQRRLRRHRLPGSVLKKIPILRFCKEQHLTLYETCAICLDDYVDGDKLRILPCAHAYHGKCIDPWLTKNRRVCPICKRKVFARGEARRHRRHSTDDSMSESDNDNDTRPLLNPVDNGTNHGTFNSTQAEGDAHHRFNPFDRQATVPIAPENGNYNTSFWRQFIRIFNPLNGDEQSANEVPDDSHRTPDVEAPLEPNASEDVLRRALRASSSSALPNQSGGTFKKCAPKKSKIAGAVDTDDDDDDDFVISHDLCIYAPISSSQPRLSEMSASCEATPSTSQQRISVAAIPNIHFNDQPSSLRESSSSPSLYSNRHRQYSSGSDVSHNDDGGQLGNYKRAPASSSDYFV